jgi:hypothetical protein
MPLYATQERNCPPRFSHLDRHHVEEELQQRPYISQYPQAQHGEAQNTLTASENRDIVQLFNSSFTNTVTLWSSKTLKGSYARPMKLKSKMTRSKKYIMSKEKRS